MITSLTISGVLSVVAFGVSALRRLIIAALRFTFTLKLYAPFAVDSPSVPTGADGDGDVSSHLIVGTVELILDEFMISLYGASFVSFWLRFTLKTIGVST